MADIGAFVFTENATTGQLATWSPTRFRRLVTAATTESNLSTGAKELNHRYARWARTWVA